MTNAEMMQEKMLSLRHPGRQCKLPQASAAQSWLWRKSFKLKFKRFRGAYSSFRFSLLPFLCDTWNLCSHHTTHEGRLCCKEESRHIKVSDEAAATKPEAQYPQEQLLCQKTTFPLHWVLWQGHCLTCSPNHPK